MAIIPTTQITVARYAAGLYGVKLGSATNQAVLADVQLNSANGVNGLNTVLNAYYAPFASMTSAQVAAIVVANAGIVAGRYGLTAQNVSDATATVTAALNAAAPLGQQGKAIADVLADWSNTFTNDAVFGAAAKAWNVKIAQATGYSASAGTSDVAFGEIVTEFRLTGAENENRTGTAGDDTFTAVQGAFNSTDRVNGGAGFDTLKAQVSGVVAPTISDVEHLQFQAQHRTTDSGDNNVVDIVGPDPSAVVKVDFNTNVTNVTGFTTIENSNSRADLIVEDVRIANNQVTKDITIVMRETDPGNVDFGVYFDQNSLRSVSSSASQLNLRVLDTHNTNLGNAPLKDSPYGSFAFSYSLNSAAPVSVTLASKAIQDAQTFPEMVVALQAAADAVFGAGAVTVSLGATYSVADSVSGNMVQGREIVLAAKGNIVFSTPAGSGWTATEVVPAISGLHTSFTSGAATSTELVTSNIILDDVGRGSTGGDLVVGGLSVGETSTSKGVQKFLIEVQDNSKLQTINSTNNTLREVVLTSGVTTRVDNAYNENQKDAGSLTVRGFESTATVPNDGIGNTPLPGINTTAPASGANHSTFGFTDVQVVDGSAFKGKLDFDAQFTSRAIDKYLSLKDVQALPAGDNVAVVYTGGSNNDKIALTLDSAAVSSRSTINVGREDFTFSVDGGAGNDEITLNVAPDLAGGAQAWYTNQKLNANITVNGGEGNDTIRTPGAGDAKINGGAGNDTIYTDNTGALNAVAVANGAAAAAATAYTNAAAAELAAAIAANVAAGATNATILAAVANDLNVLNLVTPVAFPAAPISHATIATATAAAVAAGALTLQQKIALDAAYNAETGGTVTAPTTLVAPAITGNVAVAGNLTAAEFAAGNALLDTYIAQAKAAAAAAAAADAAAPVHNGLLNGTQTAVVNNTLAANAAQATVTNLGALQAALVSGATDAQVVAAIQAATANGAIAAGVDATLFAAATSAGAGTVDAAELAAVNLILAPLVNTAANANTTAQTALTNAKNNDANAVRIAAGFAAADPVNAAPAVVAGDAVGSAEAAAAATAAKTAYDAFVSGTLTPAQTKAADLATLKAALAVGVSELQVSLLTTNAVAKGTISAADKGSIDGAAGAAAPAVGGAIDATEKTAVDLLITALQLTQEAIVAEDTIRAADLKAIADATATASTIATAAANSGGQSLVIDSPKAVFVFNTADQSNTYDRLTSDVRNLADLKSDANNAYNFFNSTVSVTYKGVEAKVVVAGTGYKTTDLEINQAIKKAINDDPVLSKLALATDGPANSLVVTSLIDGVHTTTDLAVTVTLPTAITVAESTAAAAAYGLPAAATQADVLAALAAAKTAFDTKGDYTTQFAESGAANGNVVLVGANSVTSTDNTVTGGAGDDVIVLSTTATIDSLSSSNETVVYAADFGKDTIVNFAAAGLGIDKLDFTALKGSGSAAFGSLTADKSIVVAAETAANDTAAEIAALFTDSATAINHVYVAYNAHNVGSVYMVADAAGTAAGNVTATLVGTIDLADAGWATLTAANFA